MIEAQFACKIGDNASPCADSGSFTDATIACVLPSDEEREFALTLGFGEDDLFSIENPSALSRVGRVRCIVSAEDLPTLYRSQVQVGSTWHKAAARLQYRDSTVNLDGTAQALKEMVVWLMPPQPLYATAGRVTPPPSSSPVVGSGLFLVEGRDIRHWWSMSPSFVSTRNADHLRTPFRSEAANASGLNPFADATAMISYQAANLPVATMSVSGSIASSSLDRLASVAGSPDMSGAMLIDYVCAMHGYHAVYDLSSATITLLPIEDLSTNNLQGQYNNRGLVMGGEKATSGPRASVLAGLKFNEMELFEGGAGTTCDGQWYQLNRAPKDVLVNVPWRAVEGRTWSDRAGDLCSDTPRKVLDISTRDYSISQTVETNRCRPTQTGVPVLMESQPLAVGANYCRDVANFSTTGNFANPTYASSTAAFAAARFATRCTASFGRMVGPGWRFYDETAVNTNLVYTIRMIRGDVVPVTIRTLDEDDWIIGPSGIPPRDPKDLVFGAGAIRARRLSSGPLLIDSPPPVRRTFAARITGATRIGASGNDYWRWSYAWTEMQIRADKPAATLASFADVNTSQNRASIYPTPRPATNAMEESNRFVSAGNGSNFIAPGYAQSDYTTSTMDCLPIATGTIVQMVEDFRDCDATTPSESLTLSPEYWFSVPNVPKFTC